MTDRLMGFTVTLTEPIREDDAEAIRQAILLFHGVTAVTGIVATPDLYMAKEMVRQELVEKLWKVLHPEPKT